MYSRNKPKIAFQQTQQTLVSILKSKFDTIIPKADHNFTGKLKLFMELFEKYLII